MDKSRLAHHTIRYNQASSAVGIRIDYPARLPGKNALLASLIRTGPMPPPPPPTPLREGLNRRLRRQKKQKKNSSKLDTKSRFLLLSVPGEARDPHVPSQPCPTRRTRDVVVLACDTYSFIYPIALKSVTVSNACCLRRGKGKETTRHDTNGKQSHVNQRTEDKREGGRQKVQGDVRRGEGDGVHGVRCSGRRRRGGTERDTCIRRREVTVSRLT